MAWIEVALPAALLLAKFLLKLFVDRSAGIPEFVSAILALPVDIIFVAASLLAGYAIVSQSDSRLGLMLFTLCICVSLINVVLWRRSESQFLRDRKWWTASTGALNVGLAITALVYAVDLISPEIAE